MGMLGALAGAGRGIQGYAATMRENEKMSWEAQQNAAAHERKMSIENLKQKGLNQRADNEMAFRTSEREAGETQSALEFDRRTGVDRENTKLAQDYAIKTQGIQFDQNLEKQQAALKTRLETTSAEELKRAKDLYTFTEDMSTAKRAEQVATLKSSAAFQGLGEKEQQTVLFSMEHPAAAQALAVMNKTDKFPIEQYRLAYSSASEQWDALDKNEKASITQGAASIGLEDPADIRDYYASDVARKATGLDRMIEQGPQGSLSYDKENDIPQLLKMGESEQQVYMDKIKVRDPELYKEVSRDLAVAANNPESAKPGMISSALQGAKGVVGTVADYGARNAPGGSTEKLNAIKKRWPGMTQKFYDLKMKEGE